MNVIMLLPLVAGLTVLVGLGAYRLHRRRQAADAAERLGMRFAARDERHALLRYAGSHLLQAGHSAHAENVMTGEINGRRLTVFEQLYEAGHGPHRLTRRATVVAISASPLRSGFLVWPWDSARECGMLILPPASAAAGPSWRAVGDLEQAGMAARAWDRMVARDACLHVSDGCVLAMTASLVSPGELPGFVGKVMEWFGEVCGSADPAIA